MGGFDRESPYSRRTSITIPIIKYMERNVESFESEISIANDKQEFEKEINHDLDEYEDPNDNVNQS